VCVDEKVLERVIDNVRVIDHESVTDGRRDSENEHEGEVVNVIEVEVVCVRFVVEENEGVVEREGDRDITTDNVLEMECLQLAESVRDSVLVSDMEKLGVDGEIDTDGLCDMGRVVVSEIDVVLL
jgi:hypothetical protein